VQWATGSVGVAAIKGVLEHPELELAGCWVHSNTKSGKDVGEIIGTAPLGVIATDSIDDVLTLDADAVVYAPLLPNVDGVAALLRSGKNVVTPLGWFYPGEKEAAPLAVAAQAGNATLHGAGVGPGVATELFPLLLSVMSTGVTFVRSEEFSDLRGRTRRRHGRRSGAPGGDRTPVAAPSLAAAATADHRHRHRQRRAGGIRP
jgi:hypothetical protein